MDKVRELVEARISDLGLNMREVSLSLGKNHAYIQQYLTKNTPKVLGEEIRGPLSEMLGVSEADLMTDAQKNRSGKISVSLSSLTPAATGTHTPPNKRTLADDARTSGRRSDLNGDFIDVPEYDVRASAGGGFYVDEETQKDVWAFSRSYITHELHLNINNLIVIEVQGDSMEPTLSSADRILVDMSDVNPAQPGIFVLWDSDRTVVKRVEKVPATDPVKLLLISDNEYHRDYEVPAEVVNIIGRVVWFARRM